MKLKFTIDNLTIFCMQFSSRLAQQQRPKKNCFEIESRCINFYDAWMYAELRFWHLLAEKEFDVVGV